MKIRNDIELIRNDVDDLLRVTVGGHLDLSPHLAVGHNNGPDGDSQLWV